MMNGYLFGQPIVIAAPLSPLAEPSAFRTSRQAIYMVWWVGGGGGGDPLYVYLSINSAPPRSVNRS